MGAKSGKMGHLLEIINSFTIIKKGFSINSSIKQWKIKANSLLNCVPSPSALERASCKNVSHGKEF